MKNNKIEFKIAPSWHIIEEIRNTIHQKLEKKLADFIEPVTICASELCENAIKYGVPIPELQEIRFSLELKEHLIRIKVSNGVHQNKDLQNVTQTIDTINNSHNNEELYLNRLRKLMENPKPGGESQLGLYRISYETNFLLKYQYKKNVLAVIAEKRI